MIQQQTTLLTESNGVQSTRNGYGGATQGNWESGDE